MSKAVIVGYSSSWASALTRISPYTFSAIGIAVAIGVSVLGAAWYLLLSLSVSLFTPMPILFYAHISISDLCFVICEF
jgi:hypothetical protein